MRSKPILWSLVGFLFLSASVFYTNTLAALIKDESHKDIVQYNDVETSKIQDSNWCRAIQQGYQAQWRSQQLVDERPLNEGYIVVAPGNTVTLEITFENIGSKAWIKANNFMLSIDKAVNAYADPASSNPDDVKNAPDACYYTQGCSLFGQSYFWYDSWETKTAVAKLWLGPQDDAVIEPGQTGKFEATFQIPEDTLPGRYREDVSMIRNACRVVEDNQDDSSQIAHAAVKFEVVEQATHFTYPVGGDNHNGYEIGGIEAWGTECGFGADCSQSRNAFPGQNIHAGEDWVALQDYQYGACTVIDDPYPRTGSYGFYCTGDDCYCGGSENSYNHPVYAVASGEIIRVAYNQYRGDPYYTLLARHLLPNGAYVYSFYVHITKPSWVDEGRRWYGYKPISMGEQIGQITSQGYRPDGTPPGIESHLHFSMLTEAGYQYYAAEDYFLGYDGCYNFKQWLCPCQYIALQQGRPPDPTCTCNNEPCPYRLDNELSMVSYEILDTPISSTVPISGNGNGQLDAGETAVIKNHMQNLGDDPLFNVDLTLTSIDPYITLVQNQSFLDVITPTEIKNTDNAFIVQAHDDLPPNHFIDLSLQMGVGDQNVQSGNVHSGNVQSGNVHSGNVWYTIPGHLRVEIWDYSDKTSLNLSPPIEDDPNAVRWIDTIYFPYKDTGSLTASNGGGLPLALNKRIAARISGLFKAEYTGVYTFSLTSEGKSTLIINSSFVITENVRTMDKPAEANTICLQKGWHVFQVEYVEGLERNGLILSYQDPRMPQADTVPTRLFKYLTSFAPEQLATTCSHN